MALGGGVGLGVVSAVEAPAGSLDEGVVHGGAFQDGDGQIQGDNGLVGHGLIDGHGLQTIHQVLQVGLVAVLTGDDGLVGAGIVGLDGLRHAQSGGVVGAQPHVDLSAVSIVGSQDVLSTLHSGLRIPLSGSNGVEIGLAGDDDQLAGVDVGLQDVHSALIEVTSVVVGGVTSGDLHVEGAGSVVQIQGVHDVLALQGAHGVVIEGHIVGHVVVHDQTVIGDDGDTGFTGLIHDGVQSLTVDGGHHQQVHAVGDHVLNVADLTVGVVVGIGQDGLIAGVLKLLIQIRTVAVPALQRLGRHGDTDLLAAAFATGTLSGGAAGAFAAAGHQRQSHDQCENQCKKLFHTHSSPWPLM